MTILSLEYAVKQNVRSLPRSFLVYLGIAIVGAFAITAAEVLTKVPPQPAAAPVFFVPAPSKPTPRGQPLPESSEEYKKAMAALPEAPPSPDQKIERVSDPGIAPAYSSGVAVAYAGSDAQRPWVNPCTTNGLLGICNWFDPARSVVTALNVTQFPIVSGTESKNLGLLYKPVPYAGVSSPVADLVVTRWPEQHRVKLMKIKKQMYEPPVMSLARPTVVVAPAVTVPPSPTGAVTVTVPATAMAPEK